MIIRVRSRHDKANCAFRLLFKDIEKKQAVFVILENILSSISSGSYVIYCSVIFYSQWSCHVVFYHNHYLKCNQKKVGRKLHRRRAKQDLNERLLSRLEIGEESLFA